MVYTDGILTVHAYDECLRQYHKDSQELGIANR